MATKRVTVCDRCGSDTDVRKYRVGIAGGSLYVVELCNGPECGAPVQRLIDEHRTTQKRATFAVTTMEQIQEAVTRAPRRAHKRATGTTARTRGGKASKTP